MVVVSAAGSSVQNPHRTRGSSSRAERLRLLGTAALRPLPALAIAIAVLASSASSASAVIVHLGRGRTLSYQPLRGAAVPAARRFDALFSNLDYNGGPVMPSNTNYSLYWAPAGSPQYPSDYQSGVNRYFEDIAHDSKGEANVESVSAQYNDAAGEYANYNSHFAGALLDTDRYPANGCKAAPICLTDAQLQTEIAKFVKAHALPRGLTTEYFLLTPPGVEDCFEPGGTQCSAGSSKPAYCAYHGDIPTGGGVIIYANDPYVTGNALCDDGNHPNESTADGVIEGGLSHEHNESITDPEPNSAWADMSHEGEENGDKCRNVGPSAEFGTPLGEAPNGASYNQLIGGHEYWYQQEWSNQGNQCLQRLTFTGERPIATFTASAGAGDEIKLDAAESTAPGGVFRYSWQFNDGLSTPVETASPSINHTFPSQGTYTVALTVFASDGSSSGTARSVIVNPEGKPTAAFSVTSGPASAGAPLAFDGANSAGPNEITSYSWNFGDGSPLQGGATLTHTYAAAGNYEVTLTVTDSASRTGSITHMVAVAPATGSGGGATPTPAPIVTTPAPAPAPAEGGSQPPASASALTATVALAASTAQVQGNGQSVIRLTCTGTASTCRGRLALTVKVLSRSHRSRTVTIATASFSIPVGSTSTVRLRLSTLGRSLLRRAHGRMSARLALSKSSPAPAQAQSRAVRLALRPARKH